MMATTTAVNDGLGINSSTRNVKNRDLTDKKSNAEGARDHCGKSDEDWHYNCQWVSQFVLDYDRSISID